MGRASACRAFQGRAGHKHFHNPATFTDSSLNNGVATGGTCPPSAGKYIVSR